MAHTPIGKTYEAPQLRVLGSIHELTQVKAFGLLGDGLFSYNKPGGVVNGS